MCSAELQLRGPAELFSSADSAELKLRPTHTRGRGSGGAPRKAKRPGDSARPFLLSKGSAATNYIFFLVTRISAESGNAVWIAKLDIDRWGPAPPMRFDDIPAPFTPDMNAAVRKAQQEDVK